MVHENTLSESLNRYPSLFLDFFKQETVLQRLSIYDTTTAPLIDFYRRRGVLLEFELTSGVADMWPKLEALVKEWKQKHVI
jgi:adenylate kinase family enzyme